MWQLLARAWFFALAFSLRGRVWTSACTSRVCACCGAFRHRRLCNPLAFGILNSFSWVTRRAKHGASAVLEAPVARPLVPLIPAHIRDYVMVERDEAVGEWAGVDNFLSVVGEEIRRLRTRGSVSTPVGVSLPPLRALDFELLPVEEIKSLPRSRKSQEYKRAA